jgi:hypothetical protein
MPVSPDSNTISRQAGYAGCIFAGYNNGLFNTVLFAQVVFYLAKLNTVTTHFTW